jgi:hypothetical protein
MNGCRQRKLSRACADLQNGLVRFEVEKIENLLNLTLDISVSLHILIVDLS